MCQARRPFVTCARLTPCTTSGTGRLPAAVTFLVAASGITVLGIGGAFWALVAGVLLRLILVRHRATA
jgi:benzoate membrane transport protein